jgi:hypothetical protein
MVSTAKRSPQPACANNTSILNHPKIRHLDAKSKLFLILLQCNGTQFGTLPALTRNAGGLDFP